MEILNVTLNPLDKNGTETLLNGNLTISGIGSPSSNIRATHGKSSGKWYWEVKVDSGNHAVAIGISNKQFPINFDTLTGTSEVALNHRMYYSLNGYKYPEAVSYGETFTVGDVIGIALDVDNGTLEFYKNGVSQGKSHTNISTLGEVYPHIKKTGNSTANITVNFGASSFVYPMPTGYNAYNLNFSSKILLLQNNGKANSLKKGEYIDLIVPKLTSENSNSSIVISASHQGDPYKAWKMFDGVIGVAVNSWIANGSGLPNNTTPYTLTVDFGEKKKVEKYDITTYISSYDSDSPKNWTFEGSNDNFSTFDILDTREMTASDWKGNNTNIEFPIENDNYYRYYRIRITSVLSGTYLRLSEMYLYERDVDSLVQLPISEQNLLKYGLEGDKPTTLNTLFFGKNYILSTTESKNLDGLLQTQINRKPLSIKFN